VSGFSEGWGRYGSVDAGISMGLHSAKMGAIFGGIFGAAMGGSDPFVCFVAGTQVVVGLKIQEDDGNILTVTAKELAGQAECDGRPVATMLRIVGYVTANIEDLKEGDYVLSRDQHDADGPLVAGRISRKYKRIADHLQIVGVEDALGRTQSLQTTDEHPFHVVGQGWTASKLLAAGDELSGAAEVASSVTSNTRQPQPAGVVVYNMEVEGSHSYFVRAEGAAGEPVWVHNNCEIAEDGVSRNFDEFMADNPTIAEQKAWAQLRSQELQASLGDARAIMAAGIVRKAGKSYVAIGSSEESYFRPSVLENVREGEGLVFGNQHGEVDIANFARQEGYELGPVASGNATGHCPQCAQWIVDNGGVTASATGLYNVRRPYTAIFSPVSFQWR